MSAASKQQPQVRGWCPGAHRPMMSGDGLVVRVRPRLARLTAEQILGLCALSDRHGNGFLDLTNRANFQIRGVAEADHEALLEALNALDLLDADPAMEGRRNILVTPFWERGDLTERLTRAVLDELHRLPELPAKIGIAVDTGPAPLLGSASADFRFERGETGPILRADGSTAGRPVTEETAIDALTEMAEWFDRRRSPTRRRMASVVAEAALPDAWTAAPTRPALRPPGPGRTGTGLLLGAPFGQIDARSLDRLIRRSGATALRVTPWRLFLLEGARDAESHDFISAPGDPLLAADACPGAPFCPQATVETRALARALAARLGGSLHVSGCVKGCARRGAADITLTGRHGAFDLVKNGHPWDAPVATGLSPDAILDGTNL